VPPVDQAGSRLVPLAGQRLAAVAQVLQVGRDLGGEFPGAVGDGLARAGTAAVLRVLLVQVQVLSVGGQDVEGEVLGEPDRPQQQHLHGPLADPGRAVVGVTADAAQQVARVLPAPGRRRGQPHARRQYRAVSPEPADFGEPPVRLFQAGAFVGDGAEVIVQQFQGDLPEGCHPPAG
jgi:hypothetical protein